MCMTQMLDNVEKYYFIVVIMSQKYIQLLNYYVYL